jgi:hypothetical protein
MDKLEDNIFIEQYFNPNMITTTMLISYLMIYTITVFAISKLASGYFLEW